MNWAGLISKRNDCRKRITGGVTQVRYVSRKRLAEARPRVRGQFVKAEVAAAFFAAQKVRVVRAFDMCFDTKCPSQCSPQQSCALRSMIMGRTSAAMWCLRAPDYDMVCSCSWSACVTGRDRTCRRRAYGRFSSSAGGLLSRDSGSVLLPRITTAFEQGARRVLSDAIAWTRILAALLL